MTDVGVLVQEAKALGARFEFSGDRVKVAAPRPLPSALMNKLRARKADVLEFLQLEFSGDLGAEYLNQMIDATIIWRGSSVFFGFHPGRTDEADDAEARDLAG